MKRAFGRLVILLLVTSSMLVSCANPTPLDQACTEDVFETIVVVGYIVVDWCDEANDGQVMCMLSVEDERQSLPVLLRTHPDKEWPLGQYPSLSYETTRQLLCGNDKACSHGAGQTWFRLKGECNPVVRRLFVSGFNNINPIK